ncbi:hypothetical protein Q9233_001677 [Columba guinea]|nr:hypothetical protein Q9233_001677 [Columba guinea]
MKTIGINLGNATDPLQLPTFTSIQSSQSILMT